MVLNKYSKITPFLIVTVIALLGLSSSANAYCGDGLLDAQLEQCDDGNFTNRDGCNSYCKNEDMTVPSLVSSTPLDNATDIATDIPTLELTFSEPLNPAFVTPATIQLKQAGELLKIEVLLNKDKTTVSITPKQALFSEKRHSIYIKGIQDMAGNAQGTPIIILFTTAVAIDRQPPVVFLAPLAGEYTVAQSLILQAYLDDRIFADNIDPIAKIYYTLDGSTPTRTSPVFSPSKDVVLRNATTLKYFAEDDKGNRTPVQSAHYTFKCGERPNAKTVIPYPFCTIQECNYGFSLVGNACVVHLDGSSGNDDPWAGALTAPTLPSPTPLNISTKPAIRFNKEHNGVIKRPLIFEDTKRGTFIYFKQNTVVTDDDNKPFVGYITPPDNLYSKDFPIHFGYTFKSIFSFFPPTNALLHFKPGYEILFPITDAFEANAPIFIFSYDPASERYTPLPSDQVTVDFKTKQVRISSDHSDIFFVAQAATGYNQSLFTDMVGHWAQNYAELLYRKNIVKGKDKGIFAPDDFLTRAEFIKICLTAIGVKIPTEDEVTESPFKDVSLSSWYVPYLQKAKELSLIAGYANGKFEPDRPINRAEAIKILISAFKFKLEDYQKLSPDTKRYPDVFQSTWYFPYVNFVIHNDLLDALRDGKTKLPGKLFGPERLITRGEMAKLAVKTIDYKANQKR